MIGKEHPVKHVKALDIAGADAENDEILTLGPCIDYLDILAFDLEVHKILGLRKEEILGAADGIERVGQLLAVLPLFILCPCLGVNRDVQRICGGDGAKKRIYLLK